ncbi:MAG TPA: ABC transporter permease [Acholeplasma sp.]|nr:ABC transporter permease [Acholeplasma sp.]
MIKKLHPVSWVFIGLVLAFLYIPLITMVVFSFNELASQTVYQGFSFKWYADIFTNRNLSNAIFVSLFVSIVSTVVSTILATLAALALSKQRKIFREIVLNVNNIPIISPDVLTAVAFLLFLISISIVPGMATMIIAHISISAPYAFVTIYPKVRALDPNIQEAAYDLGATPVKALFKVILPQLSGVILAGAAMAFTISFDDYIISVLSSGGIQNISVYLYSLTRGIEPSVNALSTIIMLVIGIKVVYDLVKSKNEKREEE